MPAIAEDQGLGARVEEEEEVIDVLLLDNFKGEGLLLARRRKRTNPNLPVLSPSMHHRTSFVLPLFVCCLCQSRLVTLCDLVRVIKVYQDYQICIKQNPQHASASNTVENMGSSNVYFDVNRKLDDSGGHRRV